MTSAADISAMLDRYEIAHTVERSASISERSGPSPSLYFKTAHGTIRLSDHDYLGADLDLRYWTSTARAEAEICVLVGVAVPADVAAIVAAEDEEMHREREAAQAARNAAETEKKAAMVDLLRQAGLDHLTGRARRQAIAELHSTKGRKRLLGGNPPAHC